ncbi:MAG: transcriptional regulator NrdR [Simkaniaceae bacterium]
MKCPFCGQEESRVTDSRNHAELNAIRRRRECFQCHKRFTTFETIDLTIQVKKRDESYEDFRTDKLIKGLEAACRHTLVSRDQILKLASEVSADLTEKGLREIDTKSLGSIVMEKLQKLDQVAYIRFACVYKRFKDMDQLIEAIKNVAFAKE